MQENIDYSSPDDGLGDKLRNAFIKVQNNFTQLFNGKVDKITGKGLSENDFTDADKAKLTGIEAGAQVNVNSDWGELDPSASGYILNKPPSMYASVGHFHFSDLATQTTPLVAFPNVPKKLTNDTLGAYTELDYAPYGISLEFWNATNNQFDFSNLSLGDSLLVRTDLSIVTTSANQSANQTFTIYLKLGIGTASEYDLLIDSFNVKTIITDLHIIKDVSFSIDNDDWKNAPAEVYILSDDDASIKVNGWYVPIVRKSVNIIDFNSDPLKLDKVTTTDVEKVYIKNADGTQGMKPVSELGGGGTSPLVDLHWASVSFVALNTWRGWTNGISISAAPSTSYGTGTLPTTIGLLYADTPVIPINGTTQINRITLNVRLDQDARTYQAYIVVADYNKYRGNEINAQVLVNQSFKTNVGSSTLVDFTINYHTPLNDKSVIYVFFRQTAGSVYQWLNADLQIY